MGDCGLTAYRQHKGGEIEINSSNAFIGIDIGQRKCDVCIMGYDGNALERTKYTNKRAAADAFAKYAAAKYRGCTAVLEATANYGFKTQLALEEHHIPYKIANPLRLKLSQSGLKTDRIDAQKLANRLRMDDIPESYAHPPEDRRALDILHDLINQVKARTVLLNRQHSVLAKYDHMMSDSGSTDSAGDKCQEFLDSLKLGEGGPASA